MDKRGDIGPHTPEDQTRQRDEEQRDEDKQASHEKDAREDHPTTRAGDAVADHARKRSE